jgi:hypothetical protein
MDTVLGNRRGITMIAITEVLKIQFSALSSFTRVNCGFTKTASLDNLIFRSSHNVK